MPINSCLLKDVSQLRGIPPKQNSTKDIERGKQNGEMLLYKTEFICQKKRRSFLVATLKHIQNKQAFQIGCPGLSQKSPFSKPCSNFCGDLISFFAEDSVHAPHSPPPQSHPANWQSCPIIWPIAPRSPYGGFPVAKKKLLNPRICQHTPGTYPRPRTNSLWRNSFHLGVWGGVGYAPGVCWGSLRLKVLLLGHVDS